MRGAEMSLPTWCQRPGPGSRPWRAPGRRARPGRSRHWCQGGCRGGLLAAVSRTRKLGGGWRDRPRGRMWRALRTAGVLEGGRASTWHHTDTAGLSGCTCHKVACRCILPRASIQEAACQVKSSHCSYCPALGNISAGLQFYLASLAVIAGPADLARLAWVCLGSSAASGILVGCDGFLSQGNLTPSPLGWTGCQLPCGVGPSVHGGFRCGF